MSNRVTCPGCNTGYTLAAATNARRVACKKCGASISIDATSETASLVAVRPVADVQRAQRGTKALDRRRFESPPIYTQPVFYVGIAATLVCVFFAVKYH